jgi:alpha-amylase
MRGSANDAYWHGVFGGIYLPHLRSAVQKELILAETLCDRNLPRKKPDYNDDERIVVLENKSLRCEISPEMGGSVTALDLRQAGINLTDSMTRQSEAYHQRLREASSPGSADHSSIHDRLEFKEPNLAEKLVLDDHPRLCFLDRFLKPDFTLEDLKFNRPVEVGDFVKGNYEIVKIKKNILVLQRKGNVNGTQFLLYKSFLLKPEEMELNVKYLVQRDINVLKDFHFAPEIHINLLAPRSDDRYLLKDNEPFAKNNLGSQGELADCKTLSLVDDYQGIRVDLRAYPQPRWLWYPVETVSLSEAGVESVYQGSAIHPVWKIGALKKEPPQIIMAIRKRPNWKPVV